MNPTTTGVARGAFQTHTGTTVRLSRQEPRSARNMPEQKATSGIAVISLGLILFSAVGVILPIP